jgi:glycine oxidase
MGTSIAWELALRGLAVTVLEKSIPGAEASSAAAGILGAETEAHGPGPMLDLCRYSQSLYPSWIKKLTAATDVDVGYLKGGCIEVAFDEKTLGEWKKKRAFQIKTGQAQLLSSVALGKLEPLITRRAVGAVYLPGDARITPPHLFRATHIAADRAGAVFQTGAYVRRVLKDEDRRGHARARGVELEDGTQILADAVIVAAGSWTPLVGGLPVKRTAIVPARGQIVELTFPKPPLMRLAFGGGCYLVPRADGRVLLGSTLEFVGFKRGVTAGGIRSLLADAIRLVPSLEEAEVTGTWSNFRPYTKDHLPLLGSTGVEGLFLASGHYRTGILLAPATAKIIADLVTQKRPKVDLSAFDPLRPES